MKTKILIIGAGQLGSRHLQGLAKINREIDIYMYDPSSSSIQIAEERFHTAKTHFSTTLTSIDSIESAPFELDVAIIATTSDVRLKVLQQLLNNRAVKNIIFEKVLFQDLQDYNIASSLLKKSNSLSWVNCTQRLWPYFKDLKTKYANDPKLKIIISGSNWGLGCNAVHNTDIAHFLWNLPATHEAFLDQEIINSKRTGFKEFTGELKTKICNGGELCQISYANGVAPFTISVIHPNELSIWNVTNSKLCTTNSETNWLPVQTDLVAPYQSQLTTQIVTNILDRSNCGLPSYEESSKIHIDTLSALLMGVRRNGKEFGTLCPVT